MRLPRWFRRFVAAVGHVFGHPVSRRQLRRGGVIPHRSCKRCPVPSLVLQPGEYRVGPEVVARFHKNILRAVNKGAPERLLTPEQTERFDRVARRHYGEGGEL